MSSIHTCSPLCSTEGLMDNHGRKITYLRLSITDRCNLRCSYCMPENGVNPISHLNILSFEELERIVNIFCQLGISKVRVTGGEPFVRKGCLEFLKKIKMESDVDSLFVTTNGVALFPHLPELKKIGISGINLSLDTLNKERFATITRRDQIDNVLASFYELLRLQIKVKVNSVILPSTTDEDILEVAGLIRDNPISLRFIELMPFSGEKQCDEEIHSNLESRLYSLFPGMREISSNLIETARRFEVTGSKGTLGLIEGKSRKFCSSCNKVRITPQGILKTCLYDTGSLNLRELLRGNSSDHEISTAIISAVKNKYRDGHQAEKNNEMLGEESMAAIGG